jgi:hypothetical protein
VLNLIFTAVALVTLMFASDKGLEFPKLATDDSPSSMRTLLEELDERTETEEGFLIAIRFQTALVPDDDIVWVIPHRRENENDISRLISEIGDDYICFDVLGGNTRFIECTPFSNIVSIRYFVE